MMEELPPVDITIEDQDGRVVIELPAGRWEGRPSEAEQLITRLFYVLGRARPGTTIVSVFVDNRLWGGKTIQADPERARRDARDLLERTADSISTSAT